MSRKLIVLGAAPALFVVVAAGLAAAGDDEAPTIGEIMVKLHKGADAPLSVLKAELKSEAPAWPKVQDASKEFVALGALLARNETPKGDQAGYEKLAAEYFELSKQTDQAAAKQDLEATRGSFGKLAASCKSCHQAHKP